jgi:hypothetical protein
MKILLKCPTRSRPQKVIATLSTYLRLATDKNQIGVLISCDLDDSSMRPNLVQEEIHRILAPAAWHRIEYGSSKTKIEACNADMSSVEYPWDIVILVSDDMIPQVSGWDDVIRSHMISRFPDTNGLLWCNDGYQKEKLNTLCVYGRKLYEEFGHIYHPEYKSFFCDTELTDRCRVDLKDRCLYLPYCIIRHEHPGTGHAQNSDDLYSRNSVFFKEDMMTYIRRKTYLYDWSILIPTIPGREASLLRLLESIREKVARVAPDLRIDICIDFDNRESSIGTKRNQLLQKACGKYMSFIDDDDDITDAYIEDLVATMRGNFPTMRLCGTIGPNLFVHSTSVGLKDYMAVGDIFQRPPNHLNPMFTDIAKFIQFKNATYGEDLDWTLSLCKAGFLTTEYRPQDLTRPHYIYNLRTPLHPSAVVVQRTMGYQDMLDKVYTPKDPVDRMPMRLTSRGFVFK